MQERVAKGLRKRYFSLLKELLTHGYFTPRSEELILQDVSVSGLSVYINNRCNLKCRHCFVHPESRMAEKELSVEELTDFLRMAREKLGLGVVAFAGKEPFLDRKTVDAAKQLDAINGLRYGIVSNGTLIRKYIPQLRTLSGLDWIDISLDGPQETHDALRGQGVYGEAIENLGLLLREKAFPYIGISTCCHAMNKDILPSFFRQLYDEEGVRNVCVIPYVHVGSNDRSLLISADDYLRFYSRMMDDERLRERPMNLLLNFEWFTLPFLKVFFDRKIFSPEELEVDDEGTPYILKRHGALSVHLKLTLLTPNWFLLTPDGFFGTMHMMSSPDYASVYGINIRRNEITPELLRSVMHRHVGFMNQALQSSRTHLVFEDWQ